MYGDNKIPVLVLHVLEGDVPKDTSIVYEDIDAAKVLDGGVDDLLAVHDAVVVGHGLTASGLNLVHNNICGLCPLAMSLVPLARDAWTYLCRVTLALERASQIVHNDTGAPASIEDGILSPKATSSARDDDDLTVVA